MTRWIAYSVMRLGLFSVLLTILILLGLEWWVSALFATVMAFALSYIFLARQREALAADVRARRKSTRSVDGDAESEDAAWDSQGNSESKP